MLWRRLEPWKWEVQWLTIGSWQQPAERIIEVGPLKTIWEVAQELSVYYSKVIQHLKQIGKVKKPDKWVPHEVTINEKSHPFQVFSSLILCNNEPFIDQIVMYKKKWILHDNQWWPAQWLDWKEAAKHFPKPSLHQKKSLGHWRSATSLIDYSFLNPNETIISENYAQQINEMHWKLQCLQPALINKGPNSSPWQRPTAQPTLQKLNELGYKVLPHLPYSPDFYPTDYPFFKHLDNFLQGKSFHSQQEAENAFQEFVESWSTDFYATGINKLISHWQTCLSLVTKI